MLFGYLWGVFSFKSDSVHHNRLLTAKRFASQSAYVRIAMVKTVEINVFIVVRGIFRNFLDSKPYGPIYFP